MSKIFEEDSEDELERYERQQISRGSISNVAYESENSNAENSGEDSAEELERWEREQLNRGIGTKQIDRFKDEHEATSLYNRGYASSIDEDRSNEQCSVEQVDMEVETVDHSFLEPIARKHGQTPSVSAIFEKILCKVSVHIEAKTKHLDTLGENLKKIDEVLQSNKEAMAQLNASNSRLFQEYESLHKKAEDEKKNAAVIYLD